MLKIQIEDYILIQVHLSHDAAFGPFYLEFVQPFYISYYFQIGLSYTISRTYADKMWP